MWTDIELKPPFRSLGGHCWDAGVEIPGGDTLTGCWESPLVLYEDEWRLGPTNAVYEEHIAADGLGRFRHWGSRLLFSTSDRSDPNRNGRSYRARAFHRLRPKLAAALLDELRALAEPVTRNDLDTFLALAGMCGAAERFARLKKFSMLDWQTLAVLDLLAARTRGAILEIGPYLGAGTIAMGRATRRNITAIELGGAKPHFALPSDDIVSDLKKNLADYGLKKRVTIVEGNAGERRTHERALEAIGGEPVGLLVIDADGFIARDLSFWLPHLAEDCVVVFDDYVTRDNKGPRVAMGVAQFTRMGLLNHFGVYGYGTYIGTLRAADIDGRDTCYRFEVDADAKREGRCIIVPIPFNIGADTHMLLQDGVPAPYPGSLHDDIRRLGDGRYDIVGQDLYFSTVGNADPTETGRIFELVPKSQYRNWPAPEDVRHRVPVDALIAREGQCHIAALPFGIDPDVHVLLEDGVPMPHPNSLHTDIRALGDGRYSIWGSKLYFSTVGNTDPVETGHVFELVPKSDVAEQVARQAEKVREPSA